MNLGSDWILTDDNGYKLAENNVAVNIVHFEINYFKVEANVPAIAILLLEIVIFPLLTTPTHARISLKCLIVILCWAEAWSNVLKLSVNLSVEIGPL